MSLRQMLRWWLGLLRPTTVTLSVSDPQPSVAAPREPVWHSLEALMLLPTVAPDRSGYLRPDVGSAERVVIWLRHSDPDTWWKYDPWTLLPLAENLMRMQDEVRHGLVTP